MSKEVGASFIKAISRAGILVFLRSGGLSINRKKLDFFNRLNKFSVAKKQNRTKSQKCLKFDNIEAKWQ